MNDIIEAISRRDLTKLQLAIKNGANVDKTYSALNNHRTNEDVTPLFYACRNAFESGATLLIDNSSSPTIFFKNIDGQNAFMLACGFSLSCVEKLSKFDHMVGYHDKKGVTPIMMAACCDQVPIMDFLVSIGHSIHDEDFNQRHALFYAIEQCNYRAAEYLLKSGVNVNSINKESYSPLMALVGDAGVWLTQEHEGDRMVKLLLSYRADPYLNINGHDSWHIAIKQKYDMPLLSLLSCVKPILSSSYYEYAEAHHCNETLPLLKTYQENLVISQGIDIDNSDYQSTIQF